MAPQRNEDTVRHLLTRDEPDLTATTVTDYPTGQQEPQDGLQPLPSPIQESPQEHPCPEGFSPVQGSEGQCFKPAIDVSSFTDGTTTSNGTTTTTYDTSPDAVPPPIQDAVIQPSTCSEDTCETAAELHVPQPDLNTGSDLSPGLMGFGQITGPPPKPSAAEKQKCMKKYEKKIGKIRAWYKCKK